MSKEYAADWGNDLWTLHCDFAACRLAVDEHIENLVDELKADRVILALTDTENWRKGVHPEYKANRKSVRKPLTFGAIRAYMHEKYEVYQRPGLEGDDILGLLLTHPSLVKGERIAVSIDKDLQTIPGYHLNDMKARELGGPLESHIRKVSEEEADYYHAFQTLVGDTTDNYKGCPGMGPVSAAKALDGVDPSLYWPVIVAAYAKKGLSEDVALMNARVARILRYTDFDFKKKEVILWTPPKA